MSRYIFKYLDVCFIISQKVSFTLKPFTPYLVSGNYINGTILVNYNVYMLQTDCYPYSPLALKLGKALFNKENYEPTTKT